MTMRHYLLTFAALAGAMLLASPSFGQQTNDDPIGALALDMEEVVLDLAAMTTDEPTQQTQQQIVGKLDKLIEELERESESMRGGTSGNNPTRPMADSQIKGGPGGIGDLHAARREGKQWAELPPHERDRILQSMSEGFPAHYQKILERYYKRLAEETPVGAETDAADASSEAANDASADEKPAVKQPAAKKPAAKKPAEGKSAAAAKRPATKKAPAKPTRAKPTGNKAAIQGDVRSEKSSS
jgi:hypothetical protein